MTIRLDENYAVEEFEYDDDLFAEIMFENAVAEMTLDELAEILDNPNTSREQWKIAYAEYCRKDAILQEQYFEENKEAFFKFQKEFKERWAKGIATPEEYDFYSDWYKDMYGCRPHGV